MDSKRLFDDAIGEPPPSTVDLDAVMARGRRAATLRRVVSPVVGATAAAVLVVVAAVVLPVRGRPDDGVAAGPPETEAPACRDLEPPPPDQASQTRQRLTTAVRELVEERLTIGERLTSSPLARDSDGNAYGPLEFFQETPPGTKDALTGSASCEQDPYAYLAHANILLHDLTGGISVKVSRSPPPDSLCMDGSRDVPDCLVYVGPHEARIQTRTLTTGGFTAWVTKSGTFVEVTSSNAAPAGTPGDPAALPLAPQQLVEIALDSRIELP